MKLFFIFKKTMIKNTRSIGLTVCFQRADWMPAEAVIAFNQHVKRENSHLIFDFWENK